MEINEKTIYVLQYALDVISNAGLGNTLNKSNWVLDESIEECIKELECEREEKFIETKAPDLCQDVVCCPLCHKAELTRRDDEILSCNNCGILFLG